MEKSSGVVTVINNSYLVTWDSLLIRIGKFKGIVIPYSVYALICNQILSSRQKISKLITHMDIKGDPVWTLGTMEICIFTVGMWSERYTPLTF